MTLRMNPAMAREILITCLVLLLTGCATVANEPIHSSPTLSIQGSETSIETPAQAKTGALRATSQLTSAVPATGTQLPLIELSTPQLIPQPIDLTCETEDIFQRMRNGFAMPDINNDLVLYHQQWYLNRPDYLRRMVERSSLYLHHIVEELDKRGLPMELALLPMVESAYNPMAYSRAKASGLWQFIPATGKRYNLDQDWWKDERRDIVASTAAALDYLQTIYDMHGDWHLALASYNWGEGSVARAINKNRAQGLTTDYLSLTMPRETKNYVPKLQALKNIFNNPALLTEINLPRVPNQPYFSTVTRTTNIDVKLAAHLAEMPVQDFVALNPAHNRPIIQSDTPMVIPTEKYDTFINNLEAREDSNKPLSAWQSYTVRPGDKLEKIAPRFGMTVANLKAVNGIKGKIKVRPGLTLLVNGNEATGPLNMAALPEQPRLPEADPSPTGKTGTAARSHLVRKGETLPKIARQYGTSVSELKRINQLRSDRIQAGTRLTLAPSAKAVAKNQTKPAAKPAQMAKQDKKPSKVTHYTVRPGDTLYSIARYFKVAINDLMRWNPMSPNSLKPGKTLTIQIAQNS